MKKLLQFTFKYEIENFEGKWFIRVGVSISCINPVPLLKFITPFRGKYGSYICRKIVLVSATPHMIDRVLFSFPPQSFSNITLNIPEAKLGLFCQVLGGYMNDCIQGNFDFTKTGWNDETTVVEKIGQALLILVGMVQVMVEPKFITVVTQSIEKQKKTLNRFAKLL